MPPVKKSSVRPPVKTPRTLRGDEAFMERIRLVLIFFGVLLVAGVGLFALLLVLTASRSPQRPGESMITSPEQTRNLQSPEGPIYGMWGTVTDKKEEKRNGIDYSVITIQSNLGQVYTMAVSDITPIRRFKAKTGDETPELIESSLTRETITKGSRVYLYSLYLYPSSDQDLLKKVNITEQEKFGIDIYEYEID